MKVPKVNHIFAEIKGCSDFFPVRRVYCVGRNFPGHVREMKESKECDPPFFFQKPRDAIVVNGVVAYPPFTADLQYELELVVAVGREAVSVSSSSALEYVYGYAVGLDMTRRDRQRECFRQGLPWEMGKSFDNSAPCSPICPVDQVGHVRRGTMRLYVNGDLKQDGRIEDMILGVAGILSELSRQYSLMPGDLIFTGTPEGVGPVVPGDCLSGQIEGLEPLNVMIV